MDLSTVKSKLSKNKYKTLEAFLGDIDLIWKNCKTYNQVESPIYDQAENMQKYFDKVAQELRQDFAQPDPDAEMEEEDKDMQGDLTYDEKLEFTNAIKKLSVILPVLIYLDTQPSGQTDQDHQVDYWKMTTVQGRN